MAKKEKATAAKRNHARIPAQAAQSCPFCNNTDVVIASNRYAYVIHDKHPYVEGHLLVIPKKHFESIMEMDTKTLCSTMALVKKMEKRLVERLGVSGITIRQNWAPFLNESHLVVRHVHFHIIPRAPNDNLYYKVNRISLPDLRKEELVKRLK
ncbi:MAG: HIT family protein [Candidatus Micrarchaeota archaeon]|nr:HIT family protein [Candidatus Micrarchaeota archaeon]